MEKVVVDRSANRTCRRDCVVVVSSAQRRLAEIATDIHAVDANKGSSEATLSTASRLDFWSKAVEFIKEARCLVTALAAPNRCISLSSYQAISIW